MRDGAKVGTEEELKKIVWTDCASKNGASEGDGKMIINRHPSSSSAITAFSSSTSHRRCLLLVAIAADRAK